MTAVLAGAAVMAVVLFLLAAASPTVLVRAIARCYPDGDRRREMIAEIHAVGVRGRFNWALELVEVAVRDAIPERRKKARVAEQRPLPDPITLTIGQAFEGKVRIDRYSGVHVVGGTTIVEGAWIARNDIAMAAPRMRRT